MSEPSELTEAEIEAIRAIVHQQEGWGGSLTKAQLAAIRQMGGESRIVGRLLAQVDAQAKQLAQLRETLAELDREVAARCALDSESQAAQLAELRRPDVKTVLGYEAGLKEGERRYQTLYDATRNLCTLVDMMLPNQMMTTDEMNNALVIVEEMREALAQRGGEAGEESGFSLALMEEMASGVMEVSVRWVAGTRLWLCHVDVGGCRIGSSSPNLRAAFSVMVYRVREHRLGNALAQRAGEEPDHD